MRHAETVTFGGSALNRAAELRGPEAQADLQALSSAKTTLFWRGKPLVQLQAEGALGLAWMELDHPALGRAADSLVFLGLNEAKEPLFLANISIWEPEELPETLNAFLDPSQQVHPALTNGEYFAELRAIMTQLSARDAELAATGRGLLEWHRTHGYCATCGAPSDMAMAGWQRNCPACNRSHFPRTDPVVIMLITHGNKVLMGRSHAWPDGMYSLLAGFVEPGETLEAAVRREVFEESGIRVGQVRYLASQPWPFPASLMFGCAGEALNADIVIDPKEIEDALWVSREEMLDVFEGVHPEIKPARKGAIAHFLLEHWLADHLE
ncbi:NAD(+) diphosphatase [Planktomarina temperata]|jgi:NAD+ diphosphatase|nr:NAD(+) diphosphatase [Planktomarina temperata]MDB2454777.1 NAD(+) diphosphatase [Planktomarina temperata]